jgi:hypothetical protein
MPFLAQRYSAATGNCGMIKVIQFDREDQRPPLRK